MKIRLIGDNKMDKIDKIIKEAFNAGYKAGARHERQRTVDMLEDNIKNARSSNFVMILRRIKEIILERYLKDED